MKQYDLEKEMRDMGVNRYLRKMSRTKQKEMETNNPIGRRLLTESIDQLTKAIQDWRAKVQSHRAGPQHGAYPYISMLPAPLVAAITARTVIDSISMHTKITKSALRIARMLEDEVRWRDIARNHPELWRRAKQGLKNKKGYDSKRRHLNNLERFIDLQFSKWPLADRTKVGMVLIELLRQSTGLVEITTRTGMMGKRATFVHPTDALLAWMKEAHQFSEDLHPVYLPMVSPPKVWTDIWNGGYLTDFIHRRPLVKTGDRGHLSELDPKNMEVPMRAINHLQGVGWKINRPIMDVMQHCWANDVPAGGLPIGDPEKIPTKPVDIESNEEARRRWRKAAARIHYENEAQTSRRMQVAQTLAVAARFNNEVIYFPWYMDFRSRMYPKPLWLQPQGPDWSRSLLTFAEGKPLGPRGVHWLKVHGANCWGEDKQSYAGRVAWTEKNSDWIDSIGKDPLGSISEWSKADEPWAFLAFCIEWHNYLKEGESYVCSLPVAIDGSSNGLQILSLMMRDPVGAAATNVTPCDTPEDIYRIVADRTMARLGDMPNPFAETWRRFGVNRGATKRPCMVVPYSGTLFAVKDYTTDWFRDELKKRGEENPFGWEETFRPCAFLAEVIWDSIGDVVGEAQKAMRWLQECSDVFMDLRQPIRWTTPQGFLIKQAYETWQNQTVKTIIGDVVRRHRVRSGTGRLSRSKNRNGIVPNEVHGGDASGAQLATHLCAQQGIKQLNWIHDSVMSLPADMDAVQKNVQKAYYVNYNDNRLMVIYNELRAQLPTSKLLPEPPEVGCLDPACVLDSEYLFS